MKTMTLRIAAILILPAGLLAVAGCKSAPPNPLAHHGSPTLAGGLPVVDTFTEKVAVTSIVPGDRKLALRTRKGNTINCKAAPQVTNFSQLQVGDNVQATITDAVAIFPLKAVQPPSAGPGVEVAGPAAGQPGSVVLQTTDARARVTKIDRSYRLLTVEYANGGTKDFKVPVPRATLKKVQKGDEVMVRATEPLAIQIEPSVAPEG